MELIQALLSEKWILSAILAVGLWLERQERIGDKIRFAKEREEIVKRIGDITKVLMSLRERLK